MTRLPAIAIASLILGVVLMVVLDIVAGIFAIADPAFLSGEDAE